MGHLATLKELKPRLFSSMAAIASADGSELWEVPSPSAPAYPLHSAPIAARLFLFCRSRLRQSTSIRSLPLLPCRSIRFGGPPVLSTALLPIPCVPRLSITLLAITAVLFRCSAFISLAMLCGPLLCCRSVLRQSAPICSSPLLPIRTDPKRSAPSLSFSAVPVHNQRYLRFLAMLLAPTPLRFDPLHYCPCSPLFSAALVAFPPLYCRDCPFAYIATPIDSDP